MSLPSLSELLHAIEQKKRELDSYRPLPAALVKNLDNWFRVELTYTSNALEGNTLTKNETALILEKGITVGGKTLGELFEALNHAEAFDFIKDLAQLKKDQLTLQDILAIHSLILKNIDKAHAGIWRKVNVKIAGSTIVLPSFIKVPDLMDQFIDWLKMSKENPVTLAADAHYKLVAIHPFVDGNGRTARLLMNLLLLQAGYPPAIIKKEERLSYINSLEMIDNTGDYSSYYILIYQSVLHSLDIYLNALRP